FNTMAQVGGARGREPAGEPKGGSGGTFMGGIRSAACAAIMAEHSALAAGGHGAEHAHLHHLGRPPSTLSRGERLRGWACKTRTGESVRELSDWNSVATSPQLGASGAAETLRVRAA